MTIHYTFTTFYVLYKKACDKVTWITQVVVLLTAVVLAWEECILNYRVLNKFLFPNSLYLTSSNSKSYEGCKIKFLKSMMKCMFVSIDNACSLNIAKRQY